MFSTNFNKSVKSIMSNTQNMAPGCYTSNGLCLVTFQKNFCGNVTKISLQSTCAVSSLQ